MLRHGAYPMLSSRYLKIEADERALLLLMGSVSSTFCPNKSRGIGAPLLLLAGSGEGGRPSTGQTRTTRTTKSDDDGWTNETWEPFFGEKIGADWLSTGFVCVTCAQSCEYHDHPRPPPPRSANKQTGVVVLGDIFQRKIGPQIVWK